MFPRFTKIAVAIALAGSIGLHWAFLQSVAWVGMVVTYSEHATLSEALANTFDGKHPCCLCREIAQGKRSEKKSPVSPELKKFEFLAAQSRFIFKAPSRYWLLMPTEPPVKSVSFTPPTPPPRAALV